MQEWTVKVAEQLDAAGAFLRERMVEYPVAVGGIGGVLLVLVFLNLVAMPLRVAWWRFICWRNRLAGKLMHWSYDSDIADAIVAITNRYYASGRLSLKARKEKFRILAQALDLPELHPEPRYHRPLHPFKVQQLLGKTLAGLKALEHEKVKPDLGEKASPKKKVRLTVVGATKVA